MEPVAGLEPATLRLQGARSGHLSYTGGNGSLQIKTTQFIQQSANHVGKRQRQQNPAADKAQNTCHESASF